MLSGQVFNAVFINKGNMILTGLRHLSKIVDVDD
jgi:hypothetical protein